MRATDERRSINAKCHSLLDLPDSSQGKQLKPQHHEASPLSQICLRRVWKKALDSGTVVSEEGFREESLASREDEGLDNPPIPVLSASTVPLRQSEAAFSSHRVEGHGSKGTNRSPSGLCSVLLADQRFPCTLSHKHPLQTPSP